MELMKLGRNLAFLSLPLMLTACVTTSEHEALQAQVSQMNRQMSTSQTSQADSWSQLVELRQEVAELRGQIDTLNNALQRVGGAQKLAETQALHGRALHMLESQMALDLQLTAPVAAEPELNVVNMSGVPAAQPAAQPVPAAPAVAPAPAGIPAEFAAIPVAPSAQKAQPADMAQALYDSGMNQFNTRQYQAALRSFSDFTKAYPKHKLASNSWFWQGECNYQMRDYAAAALAYENVISGFPNSVKAPASYLKQGMCFLQLGKKAAAKQRLRELTKKFPKAPETTRAKQVMKQNNL
jgi:tol-pal system protein YbgF